MKLIDIDALWKDIDKHSYPVRHGVGFYDVDHGITMDGIRQCIADAPIVVQKRYEWISVKDRLPKKEGRYLTVVENKTNGSEWVDTCYYTPKYEWDGPSGPYWCEVKITHWMELPELPEESEVNDA